MGRQLRAAAREGESEMTTARQAEDRRDGEQPSVQPLSASTRWTLLGLLIAALTAGVLLWQLQALDAPLRQTGFGILSLELAGSTDRAGHILQTWRDVPEPPADHARSDQHRTLLDRARTSVLLDFAFIPAYALTLLLLLRVTLLRLPRPPAHPGAYLGLPVAAGALDLVENLLLLQMLGCVTPSSQAIVRLATLAATAKFLLLLGAMATLLCLLGFWLFYWQRNRDRREQSWPFIKPIESVLCNEAHYLRSRRRLAGLVSPFERQGPPIGLCLSGGGIRSATISLGVLQTLMKSDFFRHVDYLSTVSGGGYTGTALSSLLSAAAPPPRATAPREHPFDFGPSDTPEFGLQDPHAPFTDPPWDKPASARPWLDGGMVVGHLRAFGDFLARRRRLLDRDVLRAAGSLMAGVSTSLMLFLVLVLLLASALTALILLNDASALRLAERGCDSAMPGFMAYLRCLWTDSDPTAFFAMGAMGLLSLPVIAALGSLVAAACPDLWFLRDGDTPNEARQYRLLWVAGGLALATGFLLCAPLADQLAFTPSLLYPLAFYLGGTLAAALAYLILVGTHLETGVLRSNLERRSFVAASLTLCIYALVLAAGLVLLPWVIQALTGPATQIRLGAPTGLTLSGGLAAWLLAWWGRHGLDAKRLQQGVGWLRQAPAAARRFVLGIAVAALILAALMLGLGAVRLGLILWWPSQDLHGALIATAVLALVFGLIGFRLDFNRLSLHYFYRDRLVDAFMRTAARPSTAYGRELEVKRDHGEMRLTELHGRRIEPQASQRAQAAFMQHEALTTRRRQAKDGGGADPLVRTRPFRRAATPAPYHLFACCLNLATERDMRFRARKSDVFVFSKLYCGSSATGYVDTGVFRAGETKVARVMTISGAAVDSGLGRETFFAQAFATTLFNMRLGQWVENPAYRAGNHVHRQERGVFWPTYLLMEALGMSDARHRLMRLSDGAHSGDNLGLIPLLQRRCRLILAVDAEQDPECSGTSLMNAIRYAETDLGIEIALSLDPLRPDKEGLSAQHFTVGRIQYPKTPTADAAEGCLILLKTSLTRADPPQVTQFRFVNPHYPQETTADQFFSEDQFEAYRQLGRVMASALLGAHPSLAQGRIKGASSPDAPARTPPAPARPEPSPAS